MTCTDVREIIEVLPVAEGSRHQRERVRRHAHKLHWLSVCPDGRKRPGLQLEAPAAAGAAREPGVGYQGPNGARQRRTERPEGRRLCQRRVAYFRKQGSYECRPGHALVGCRAGRHCCRIRYSGLQDCQRRRSNRSHLFTGWRVGRNPRCAGRECVHVAGCNRPVALLRRVPRTTDACER